MQIISTTDFYSLFLGTDESNKGKAMVSEQEKAQQVRETFRARQTGARLRSVVLDLSKLAAEQRRGE